MDILRGDVSKGQIAFKRPLGLLWCVVATANAEGNLKLGFTVVPENVNYRLGYYLARMVVYPLLLARANLYEEAKFKIDRKDLHKNFDKYVTIKEHEAEILL